MCNDEHCKHIHFVNKMVIKIKLEFDGTARNPLSRHIYYPVRCRNWWHHQLLDIILFTCSFPSLKVKKLNLSLLFHFLQKVMTSSILLMNEGPSLLFHFLQKVMRRRGFTLASLFVKSDDIINFIDERGTSLCRLSLCRQSEQVNKWKE